jgi:hypothetical protein
MGAKFFGKIRQNVGIFFRRRKNQWGKNGGIWDAGGYQDAGRRDAMHRVSTDGVAPILFILPGIGCSLWPESDLTCLRFLNHRVDQGTYWLH